MYIILILKNDFDMRIEKAIFLMTQGLNSQNKSNM